MPGCTPIIKIMITDGCENTVDLETSGWIKQKVFVILKYTELVLRASKNKPGKEKFFVNNDG